ncbi:MAG: cytochrome c [Bacteroidetes bacterium]|jgi:mono/diheme cytochrome c family protein|nr:cytochrome c [Bacteroidota bacterium]
MRPNIWVYCCISLALAGCLSDNYTIKKRQYASQGRLVYQKQCVNCHQDDGNGYARLYPPLHHALQSKPLDLVCLILEGRRGSVVIDGESYTLPMPAFGHLKDDELAKLLTYLYNTWGQEGPLVGVDEVEKQTRACRSK